VSKHNILILKTLFETLNGIVNPLYHIRDILEMGLEWNKTK